MSETKLARTLDQWRKCDPEAMANMSQAAIMYALKDAKHDILALASPSDAAQAPDLSRISTILASEIECSIFERHVQPALEVARKGLVKDGPSGAIAWMVIGHYTELFTDLEEASKYALTIGMEVTPLYAAPVATAAAAPSGWQPIETAPKDGTKVDLWVEHSLLSYSAKRHSDCWHSFGEWREEGPNGAFPHISGKPTHWMPLPALPDATPAAPTPTVAADAAAPTCTHCQPYRDATGELVLPLCRCKQAAQPDERAAFEAWWNTGSNACNAVNKEWTEDACWFAWQAAWQASATAPQATITKLAESNAELRAQIERYQAICASAYQLAGAVDAPLRFLDALASAANGEPVSEEAALDLLPVTVEECAAVPQAVPIIEELSQDSRDFKNFHRLLCERFGYAHDEKDWRRDQISLIEWIADTHKTVPFDAMEHQILLGYDESGDAVFGTDPVALARATAPQANHAEINEIFERQQAGFARCFEALGIGDDDDRERGWSSLVLAINDALAAAPQAGTTLTDEQLQAIEWAIAASHRDTGWRADAARAEFEAMLGVQAGATLTDEQRDAIEKGTGLLFAMGKHGEARALRSLLPHPQEQP